MIYGDISIIKNVMEVVNNIEEFNFKNSSAITIGTFDGIHLGHQQIINELCKISKRKRLDSIIVTFSPHPQTVLKSQNKKDIKILTTIKEKIDFLLKLDVDYLVIIQFTKEFSNISYSKFIESYIINKLNAREIVIGYNHAFGKNREGSVDSLINLGKEFNFNVNIVEPVKYKDEIVSSTRIRNVLIDGNVYEASQMLGRNYLLLGRVIKGSGIGSSINVPTANIELDDDFKLIPKNGIYIAKILVREMIYNALLYIGTKPTFNLKKLFIEVNIFDFNDNIYDESIAIEIIERLRPDKKFKSIEALTEQIQKDREECFNFFNKYEVK